MTAAIPGLPVRLLACASLGAGFLGAGFLAGKCYLAYRRRGRPRTAPLPDFYVGAHAAIRHLAVLTRDAARYRTYFRTVEVLAPTER
jgi:predicted nucleic acid-binding protein